MAVADTSGGNILNSPAIACWGSTVYAEVQLTGNGEFLAFGTLGSGNWIAINTDNTNSLNLITSQGSGQLDCGPVSLGQRFWVGWTVDASGNLAPFIASIGYNEATAVCHFFTSTLTAPNTTDSIALFGLPGYSLTQSAAQNLIIHNSVLTQSQIESEIGSGPSGAWAYYPLSSVADLTDHSGNGRAALTQVGSNNTVTLATIQNPASYTQSQYNILCCGNSKTLGLGATTSYPTWLAGDLPSATITNNGHASHDTQACIGDASGDVLGHYIPGKLNVVWMFEYTNDDLLDGLNATQIVSGMAQYANYVRGFGFYLIHGDGSAVTGGHSAVLSASNALLLAGGTRANAFCDMGSDANLNTPTNATYFQSDGIHWTDAGNHSAEQDFLGTFNTWISSFTVVTSQPSGAIVLNGHTATFTVAASGLSLTYQWQKNGVNVSGGSGGTTTSYTTPTLSMADNGSLYTCVVTGTNGVVTTIAAQLTVVYAAQAMWLRA